MNCAPPSKPPHRSPRSIAPGTAVLLALLLCGVAVALLIPNRHELFKRHLADGDAAAAGQLLDRDSAADAASATAALAAEAIGICHDDGWNESSLAILTGFLRRTGHFRAAAGEVLRRAGGIPPEARTPVLAAIVARALAEHELPLAGIVQMRLLESAKPLTPGLARQAVQTFRYAGNPGLALAAIDRLETSGESLPPDLAELRVTLARETSQPEVAFALLEQRVRGTNDPHALRKLIPEALKTGIEAGRQKDLVPLYEKYLALPAAASGPGRDPLRDSYTMQLAQIHEWNAQPDKAFDLYLRLARKGRREALDRCLELNPGLFRTGDLLSALLAGYEVYSNDDELVFLTARLLGEAARRDEALRVFSEHLARHPGDAEAHYRLALIFDETQQFERAFEHFRKAHELDPDNDACLEATARTALTLGRYQQALGLWRSLSHRTRDIDHAEQFHQLATALEDLDAIRESLRLRLDIDPSSTVTCCLALADLARSTGHLDKAAEALHEAVQAGPEHPFIRIELAEVLLARKQPARALKALEDVPLRRHAQAAQAAVAAMEALRAASGLDAVRGYLEKLGRKAESNVDLAPAAVLQLAELFRAAGLNTRAGTLFRRVLQDTEDPGELARACFHLGRLRAALRYQLVHIRKNPRPGHDDYSLLGDIHTGLGERTEARAAYRRALSLLTRRTVVTP